jgi:recombination protein RecA
MQRNSTASLAEIIAAMQRRWGTRALRLLRDSALAPTVLSTGFVEFDRALAIGGVPRGRLTELLGTPTSGMMTIALTLIARAQAQGDLAGYIDLSKTFDAEYAALVGVDLTALLLIRPRSAADALEVIQARACAADRRGSPARGRGDQCDRPARWITGGRVDRDPPVDSPG